MSKSSNEETKIHNEKYCSKANPIPWCDEICGHNQPSELCQKYIDNKKKQQENHSANSREQTDIGTEEPADNGNISYTTPHCNADNAECERTRLRAVMDRAQSDLETQKTLLQTELFRKLDEKEEERKKQEEKIKKEEEKAKTQLSVPGGARKSRKHKRTRKRMRKHTRKHKVMKSKMTKSKSKKEIKKKEKKNKGH